MMRVGIYQSHPVFGDVDGNLDQVFKDLPKGEADLWVLPELFSTGYQFVSLEEVDSLAEEIPNGRTCRALTDLAGDLNAILVFGMAEKVKKAFYNSAAVVSPKGFVGAYRKIHLFAEEKIFFTPGDLGFRVFDVGEARIGVMICFDWWFPESARILSLQGADLLCHPANLVLPHCQKAMMTRSLENGVYSATANRVGTEARGGKEPLGFTGKSQIVDPAGQVLMSLGETDKSWAVAEIKVETARNKKITPQNDRLGDRRPDLYGRLCE